MRELFIQPKALKQLAALPVKDRSALTSKLRRYANGESEGLDIKRLQGRDGFRLRHGDWRAIVNDDGVLISVIRVAHRREVY